MGPSLQPRIHNNFFGMAFELSSAARVFSFGPRACHPTACQNSVRPGAPRLRPVPSWWLWGDLPRTPPNREIWQILVFIGSAGRPGPRAPPLMGALQLLAQLAGYTGKYYIMYLIYIILVSTPARARDR